VRICDSDVKCIASVKIIIRLHILRICTSLSLHKRRKESTLLFISNVEYVRSVNNVK